MWHYQSPDDAETNLNSGSTLFTGLVIPNQASTPCTWPVGPHDWQAVRLIHVIISLLNAESSFIQLATTRRKWTIWSNTRIYTFFSVFWWPICFSSPSLFFFACLNVLFILFIHSKCSFNFEIFCFWPPLNLTCMFVATEKSYVYVHSHK